jgi:hypothetical protein
MECLCSRGGGGWWCQSASQSFQWLEWVLESLCLYSWLVLWAWNTWMVEIFVCGWEIKVWKRQEIWSFHRCSFHSGFPFLFFVSASHLHYTITHFLSLSLSLFSEGALDLEYNPQVHIWDAKSCMNKWKTVRRNRNWPKMQVWLCVGTLYVMQQIYLVSVLSGLFILPPYTQTLHLPTVGC